MPSCLPRFSTLPVHDPSLALVEVPQLVAELVNPAHYRFSPLSLLHWGAAGLIAAISGLVLWWERGKRSSLLFAGFTAVFILWAVLRGAMINLVDPRLVTAAGRYMLALMALALPLLLQFVSLVLHREKQRWPLTVLTWVVCVPLAILSVGSVWMANGVHSYSWGFEPAFGPLGYVLIGWIALLIGVTSGDWLHSYRQSLAVSVERKRLTLLGVALVCLYGAAVDFAAPAGIPVYPLGFLATIAFTFVTAFVTWRYGLVEVTAQLAAAEVAGMTRGALLILDADGVVRVVNERTENTLGLAQASMIGHSAQALLGDAFSPERVAALAASEDAEVEKELSYLHPRSGRLRDLVLSVVAVKDSHARDVAYVCVLRDLTDQKLAEKERLKQGLTDPLTGLPNRTLFIGLLDAAIERARSSPGYTYAVCFLGVDRMRVVNEDLGYAAGDRVLLELAGRLRKAARPQDAVARIGGDEFGLLLRSCGSREETSQFVQQLRETVTSPLVLGDHSLYLSASIGVASGEHSYSGGADLLRAASVAMYRAKESDGSAQFASGETSAQRTRLEAELRAAFEQREFRVHYQPVVDLDRRRVSGFEALVRWNHPRRGLVLPGEFLELAEEVGLMQELDWFVLRQACRDLGELQRAAADPLLAMSVNLSEASLLKPALVERVQEALAGQSAAGLRIEILERVAQIDPLRDTLARLRQLGAGLYIDDFGTRYSALSRLHELPVTALKIDRAFVRAMSRGEGGEKIIAGILSLARSLELDAIAEGAGTDYEVRRLSQLGCRHVQGFYFSKGLPLAAAIEFLHDEAGLERKIAGLGITTPAVSLEQASPSPGVH